MLAPEDMDLISHAWLFLVAHPIEAVAAAFGLAGSLLLAVKSRSAGWGFVLYLASNVGWLAFAYANGHWFMFAQQVGFTGISLLGIWTWRRDIAAATSAWLTYG